MLDKPFLAHLPQNQLLGPSLPIWLKFHNSIFEKCCPLESWITWGAGYKNWMIGYRALSNILYKFPQLFGLKGITATLQTKWGMFVCENLIWGCKVMLDQPFLAHLLQNQLLTSSLPICLKYQKLIYEKCCP